MSEPRAKSQNSAATATADPEELPPGINNGFKGFFTGPKAEVSPEAPQANSSMLTIPRIIASCSFNFLITVASNGAIQSFRVSDAQAASKPLTHMFDLIATQIPASFPTSSPLEILLSNSSACFKDSSLKERNIFSSLFFLSIFFMK